MLSYFGQHIPTLFALMVCLFSITLLYVSVSENWNAHQASKRKRAADRTAPMTDKVTPG